MAEPVTIARPYAKAAFAAAEASGKTAEWSRTLARAAKVVETPDFAVLIGNPNVDAERLATLLTELAGEEAADLFELLAERGRVAVVPAIHESFEVLRADAENRIDVEVVSATELDDEHANMIVAALEKRLGRKVAIEAKIDATLLGGAIIRAGDLVIDGSVKGRLEKLAASL